MKEPTHRGAISHVVAPPVGTEFNVDGSKWQAETMRSIADYLAPKLPKGLPVLA